MECCVQENNCSQKQIVIYNTDKSHIYRHHLIHRHVNLIHCDIGSKKKSLYEGIDFCKNRRCLLVNLVYGKHFVKPLTTFETSGEVFFGKLL